MVWIRQGIIRAHWWWGGGGGGGDGSDGSFCYKVYLHYQSGLDMANTKRRNSI